jgi:peptide chain release factor 2
MLGRMYLRWAVNKRYDAEILYTYETPDSNVGIKKCEFIVRGENAYGLLKNENGVHRLIRKSPFDKAKKRHTSFASVKVEPEIDDTIDIQINKSDLNIERMRGSGSGGQHKNVTASAVRITHIPTGITAYCQNDRSQHKNKESAMKTLYSRLYVREMEEKAREINDKNSNYDQNAFGSQIRTYCVHPTQYIIDHRCNHKEFSIKNILDGNIDDFIMENLKTNNKKEMLNG